MNCDQCDNEATVFLTEIAEGKVRRLSLCAQCAKEYSQSNGEDTAGLELSDLLWGLGHPEQKVSMENEPEEREMLCPHCGFTGSDFDKTERLGCPHCYGVYAERLSGMWKNFQSGTTHTGKRPAHGAALTEAAPPPEPAASTPAPAAAKPRKKPAAPEWQERESAEEEAQVRITEVRRQVTELQAQMAEALREEAYERAAKLRDDIREREQQIQDFEQRLQAVTGESA
jgi:protein arginine kinase activator